VDTVADHAETKFNASKMPFDIFQQYYIVIFCSW